MAGSKYIVPLHLPVLLNPVVKSDPNFIKLFARDLWVTHIDVNGIERDIVLDRPLDNFNDYINKANIVTPTATVLTGLQRIQATLNNVRLIGDVTGQGVYNLLEGKLDIDTTVTDGGLVGPQGEPGIQGEAGADGNSFQIKGYLDSVDDLPLTENELGDGYFVGEDKELWYWGEYLNEYDEWEETWVNYGSLVGISGPIGPQGPAGPIGPQGIQGLTGPQGEDGTSFQIQGYVDNIPDDLPVGYVPELGHGWLVGEESNLYYWGEYYDSGLESWIVGWIDYGPLIGLQGPQGEPGVCDEATCGCPVDFDEILSIQDSNLMTIWDIESPTIKYGLLYNYFAATDNRKITSSDDWSIGSDDDWTAFIDYLVSILGDYTATGVGGLLKETGFDYWDSPNTGATNELGFNARGAGVRASGGTFLQLRTRSQILQNFEVSQLSAGIIFISNDNETIPSSTDSLKANGLSVRLSRPTTTAENSLTDGTVIPSAYTGNNGFTYDAVKIGNKIIINSNLNETQYRNGDIIPLTESDSAWLLAGTNELPACCYYNNDITNGYEGEESCIPKKVSIEQLKEVFIGGRIQDATDVNTTGIATGKILVANEISPGIYEFILEDNIEGGDVNVIEEVQVNGVPLTVTSKSVNVPVPINSDFTLSGLSERSYNSLDDIPSTFNPTSHDNTKHITNLVGEDGVINAMTEKTTIDDTDAFVLEDSEGGESDFRIPTEAEWDDERLSWDTNDAAGAFGSPLKLPVAGYRHYSNGALNNVGSFGRYWSSTVDSTFSRLLRFYSSSDASIYSDSRAVGSSVRLIKDGEYTGDPEDFVSETLIYNGLTYQTVLNPTTNRIWLDRNLGAIQVATSSTDADAYGDLYQWGRDTDGHQIRTSDTTVDLSSSDNPGHGDFILAPNSLWDWRDPQNDNLWQGVSGINLPWNTIPEFKPKKSLFSTIKATLQTHFNALYSTFSGSYNDLTDKPTIPDKVEDLSDVDITNRANDTIPVFKTATQKYEHETKPSTTPISPQAITYYETGAVKRVLVSYPESKIKDSRYQYTDDILTKQEIQNTLTNEFKRIDFTYTAGVLTSTTVTTITEFSITI